MKGIIIYHKYPRYVKPADACRGNGLICYIFARFLTEEYRFFFGFLKVWWSIPLIYKLSSHSTVNIVYRWTCGCIEPNVHVSYGGVLMHRCDLKLLDGQANLTKANSHLINDHRAAPRSLSRLCRDALRLRQKDELIWPGYKERWFISRNKGCVKSLSSSLP